MMTGKKRPPMPTVWDYLLAAARETVSAVDARHDQNEPPLKYTVPFAAINSLRDAVAKCESASRVDFWMAWSDEGWLACLLGADLHAELIEARIQREREERGKQACKLRPVRVTVHYG